MMKFNKTRAMLAGAALCMAVSAFAQTPIKIGYVNTLSGPLGTIGQDMYDGFMLGVEQNGGKLGGSPVQILKQDDQFKPDVAAQIVQKLIDKENVPIITGIAGSNIMMAVQKQVVEKEVFLISANAGPSPLAGAQCSPYQFVASWQNDSWAEAAGQYATDKGYKRMVLLASNYQAGKDAIRGFKKFFKGTVVAESYPGLTQPDFAAELAPISANKPDAVFAFMPGGQAVTFMRQYQQAGLMKTVPLLTVGMADGTTLPALKESALGVQAVHFWAPDTDNATNREFVAAFEKRYDRIPSNFSAQGYDSALLLDSAIGRVKGNVSDKKAFMEALKAGSKSVRGTLKFNNNNFPINDWYAFEVAKDAKGRVSLKTVATPLKDYQDSYHTQCPMK
jgi:branched-chain amino acid transport system substrate-binding protein